MGRSAALAAALGLLGACSPEPPVASEILASYLGSASCAECHASEFEAWSGSHHDLAMQPATPETVLGDFDDALFEHRGLTTRFFRRDDAYFVNTEGADGRLADFEVLYAFGFDPLQQYLIEFEGGRLQCLTVAWDTQAERWYHLYPDERIPPDDPLHWTQLYQGWNTMCAECHSTALRKNYDAASDTYSTTFEDLDVGCESCHGPGEEHVRWAETAEVDAESGKLIREDEGPKGLAVILRRGMVQRQIDACSPCHSRRTQLGTDPLPADPFLDHYLPQLLHEGLYYADGQILEEVYVFGSFLQSKMYAQGVACSDCHDPHSVRLMKEGNALCTQCHTIYAPIERFPNLLEKNYNTPEHHFHEAGTEAALCVSCHMPSRTYMIVDPRRDHSFRIPRPDLSVKLGLPNACNACHNDQSAQWSVEAVEKWYGPGDREPHFAQTFALARAGRREALEGLLALAADREQAGIVRATALELLLPFGRDTLFVVHEALGDADPLVRTAAARAMDGTPLEVRRDALPALLEDPVRSVRIEAARVLAAVPIEALPEAQRAAFETALAEYVRAQELSAERPSAHLNLGRLHEDQGRPKEAEHAYRKALERDAYFLPARFNLANLLNAQRRNDEAEQVLRGGIERVPEHGELHYSLGLLLGEEQRLEEAAAAFAEAARLLPDRPRVHYNLGLTLQHLGRRAEAEVSLRRASELDRRNPELVRALAILQAQLGNWTAARSYAERLVALTPGSEESRRLLEEILRNEAAAGRR